MVKHFFGLRVCPGKTHRVELGSNRLQITSLCLDKSAGKKMESQLWVTDTDGKKKHLIAVISRNDPMCSLDITFSANQEVCFLCESDTDLHLVGYTFTDFVSFGVPPSLPSVQNAVNKPIQKSWVELTDGIRIKDLEDGFGNEAKLEDVVEFVYETRLKEDEPAVITNVKTRPIKTELGSQINFKGWNVGIVGMKVGSKRRLACPPNTAYGKKGFPPNIPPNADIFFDIQLEKISVPAKN